jgi:molybdopterin synthase sulfur carrier subunit
MPRVILAGSIRDRAGGLGAIDVEGATVRAAIQSLEACYPALRGWVRDERGLLRRHVKLFLRGEAVALDAPLAPGEELHVVAAISGG